jgi:hypothetical protein
MVRGASDVGAGTVETSGGEVKPDTGAICPENIAPAVRVDSRANGDIATSGAVPPFRRRASTGGRAGTCMGGSTGAAAAGKTGAGGG